LDNSKANEKLGWRPRYSLEEGLEKTIKWYMNHQKNEKLNSTLLFERG
jgi:nucleoside-diphosphate-sugar epimerase